MRQCDRRAVESLQILHHTIQCKQVVDDCSLVDVGFLAVWVMKSIVSASLDSVFVIS